MRAMGAVLPAPFLLALNTQPGWSPQCKRPPGLKRQPAVHTLIMQQSRTTRWPSAWRRLKALLCWSIHAYVDGLSHRRLRGLVSKVFTPKYIEDLRPGIEQIANRLLDRVAEAGSMDLVEDYAYPLPINVISDMLAFRMTTGIWSRRVQSDCGWGTDYAG